MFTHAVYTNTYLHKQRTTIIIVKKRKCVLNNKIEMNANCHRCFKKRFGLTRYAH